jgi:hypothetical protein
MYANLRGWYLATAHLRSIQPALAHFARNWPLARPYRSGAFLCTALFVAANQMVAVTCRLRMPTPENFIAAGA